MPRRSQYPKTLVKSEDPTSGLHMVVHTDDEEDEAKKLGFGGAYKPFEYPVMLYKKGKPTPAHKEQGKDTTRVANSPEEEEKFAKEGFKRVPEPK